MLHKNKRLFLAGILMLTSLTVLACNNKNNGDDVNQVPTVSPTISQEETNKIDPEATDNNKSEETKIDVTATKEPAQDVVVPETKEVPVYGISDDTQMPEAATALVPKEEEITPQVIVDAVVEILDENGVEVSIESVTQDADKVIVSFYKDSAPVINVGSGVEVAILDCISQSLLDNVDSCTQVIFRIEGKAYESGHMLFGVDEVYKFKNK